MVSITQHDAFFFLSFSFFSFFADGERCGKTLQSIFENAKYPDKVVVGVVEQNAVEDEFCLDQYCKAYGKLVVRVVSNNMCVNLLMVYTKQKKTRITSLTNMIAHCRIVAFVVYIYIYNIYIYLSFVVVVIGFWCHNPQGALVFEKKENVADKTTTKIVRNVKEALKCPHLDQIRLLAIHHYAAKGPMYARSLIRKVLGNEQFCLQIDAHSTLSKHWDEGLSKEWQTINNDFAVLSTIPLSTTENNNNNKKKDKDKSYVPRQCQVTFQDNGIPNYDLLPNTYVDRYSTPLLSHAWSAAFSFAKCHLEETVPYDPFSQYTMEVEQFVRYTRMWTRGYDTYTPTKNYVTHDYTMQTNGHGEKKEWSMSSQNRFRTTMAIRRAKLILEITTISEESETLDADRANLGIYGLGQRRSLSQFQTFTGVTLTTTKQDLVDKGPKCVEGHVMVKFDATISPLANLHDEGATKLDPNPLFPLRTSPIFSTYYDDVTSAEAAKHLPDRLDTDHLEIAFDKNLSPGKNGGDGLTNTADLVKNASAAIRVQELTARLRPPRHAPVAAVGPELLEQVTFPPTSVLFVLWIFGLMIWYFVFAVQHNSIATARMGDDDKSWLSKAKASVANSNSNKTTSTTSSSNSRKTKLVKDV